MLAKPWNSATLPILSPARDSGTLRASSFHPDPPSSLPDSPANRRARPKENVGVRRRRLKDQEPAGAPVSRLQRLSLRAKAIRSAVKEPVRPFSEAPPTLADLVCLAILEANLARPAQHLTVSNIEWPSVRVDSHWASAIQACLLCLADLAGHHPFHVELSTSLPREGTIGVDFTLARPPLNPGQDAGLHPNTFVGIQRLNQDIRITVSEWAITLRLNIPQANHL